MGMKTRETQQDKAVLSGTVGNKIAVLQLVE